MNSLHYITQQESEVKTMFYLNYNMYEDTSDTYFEDSSKGDPILIWVGENIDCIMELNNALTQTLINKFREEAKLNKYESIDKFVNEINSSYKERLHKAVNAEYPQPIPLTPMTMK